MRSRHAGSARNVSTPEPNETSTPRHEGSRRKRRTDRAGNRRKNHPGKKTTSILAKAVDALSRAWWFAHKLGKGMNAFITIKPGYIDEVDPDRRMKLWQTYLNKLGQFARDHQFTVIHLWTRESQRGTGRGEHLHVLMHIPEGFFEEFREVVSGWPGDIDVRRASYESQDLPNGKKGDVLRYIAKNCPQKAYGTSFQFKPGGPIFGKRCGTSRSVGPLARMRYYRHSVLPYPNRPEAERHEFKSFSVE